ncbi:50S ribosomal protein L6 [Symbiobacterium thermophilum]|uniref:Large ribosomal subunit protein uL6 n=2 Tax=Symbiobacterium thermophilum TaxID=2734 RepID=RL6_SYMTH|nr:50S ribosomal protein L6 [Symbiobacterium thermophilum]Q67JV8.1 RecName: Full=Large ribosomal subunit protein uL6; AltName: Full=50S ribosomal protein L6 [Symbiobacterium thermophilum IAM 14863]MBY6274769.1 50S ribosomal protein L6 [Symbiobacterium thermophilum]BAD42042.1 50S ribosomal protein L6 [Symbiobacterium thermophilum IAM 14863]
MSRIGKAPIEIPAGVEVTVEGNLVRVKGPKGELSREIHPAMSITIENGALRVSRPSDEREHKALHGLTRTLIANMVEGVTKGYSKTLELVGTGYRAAKTGNQLTLSVGYSHPVVFNPPPGIEFQVPAPNQVIVAGIDKQLVGQVAADIRATRPPEPYLGKGIKYAGEHIRRKVGKAGK